MYISRPNDSRMLVALGESYEKLSQQVEAKKVHVLKLPVIPGLCNRFTKLPEKDPWLLPWLIFYILFLSSVTGGHTLLEM